VNIRLTGMVFARSVISDTVPEFEGASVTDQWINKVGVTRARQVLGRGRKAELCLCSSVNSSDSIAPQTQLRSRRDDTASVFLVHHKGER
jgi:hypothetical protein